MVHLRLFINCVTKLIFHTYQDTNLFQNKAYMSLPFIIVNDSDFFKQKTFWEKKVEKSVDIKKTANASYKKIE